MFTCVDFLSARLNFCVFLLSFLTRLCMMKIFFRISCLFLLSLDEHSFYKGEMVTDRLSVALSENDVVRYVAAASSISQLYEARRTTTNDDDENDENE